MTLVRKTDLPPELNAVSERVIGCAIEVHRELGPGLVERVYEDALEIELQAAGLKIARQRDVPVFYKGVRISGQRIDLLIEECVVVELKAVARVEDLHLAQLVSYLRVARCSLGLLLNFNFPVMKNGVYRRVNQILSGHAPVHSALASNTVVGESEVFERGERRDRGGAPE